VEEFSKSFLELMSLLKTLEQYPKVAVDKEHLHWIEAYAGHIYQQFHEEFLQVLKEKISVDDKAEYGLQKRWEKAFWARIQAAMKELGDRFSIIKKDFPDVKVDANESLPTISITRMLSLRYRFRKNLMNVTTGILILISVGCENNKEKETPVVVTKKLFSLMSGMRGEVQIGRTTWHKFLYNGKIVAKRKAQWSQIADEFDEWDKSQGDKYKNVGWKNVKIDGKHIIVVAKPKKKGEVSEPEEPRSRVQGRFRVNRRNAAFRRDRHRFEEGFIEDLEQMCQRLNMNPMGLLSVMHFETRGTFSPRVRNPTGSATGLIQFVETTARGLGTSTRALARMTQRQQLRYVERYFRQFRRRANYRIPRNIAAAVFYPAALGRGSRYVIGRRGTRAYRQNRRLDVNRDGRITIQEYTRPALTRSGYL